MKKIDLMELKNKLIAIALASTIMGTTGCSLNKTNDDLEKYSHIEDYYKYSEIHEDEKLYKSRYVYLLYDKETYAVSEYIYRDHVTTFGGGELYDLESEKMLAYSNGITTTYNEDYYNQIRENNYQVPLARIRDYIPEYLGKGAYTLEEIRELEPLIAESLKAMNNTKTKAK